MFLIKITSKENERRTRLVENWKFFATSLEIFAEKKIILLSNEHMQHLKIALI